MKTKENIASYKLFENLQYVLKAIWKWEPILLLLISVQIIVSVLLPLGSIYIQSVIVSGVMGELVFADMVYIIIAFTMGMAICACSEQYIKAISNTHTMNIKIHFLTKMFEKKWKRITRITKALLVKMLFNKDLIFC